MKKILFLLRGSLLFVGSLFAQSIQLSTPSPQVDINNPFTVAVTVVDGPQGGTVTLDGVDDFDVVGQSTATTMQIVNGVRQQGTQLQLQLKAKENGIFVLGPARIQGNGSMESNSIEIEVVGDKLFVNGTPQGRQPQGDIQKNEGSIDVVENESQTLSFWIPLLIFLMASLGGIALVLKKKKSLAGVNGVESEEVTDFVELGKKPELVDPHYYDKTLSWIGTWIELQTGQKAIGKSPEAMRQVRLEHGYHGVDDEPIIEMLTMVQLGLYQGDESEKEDLHILLQSL